jgi:AAA+ ATPase superfamily predicted ATPase
VDALLDLGKDRPVPVVIDEFPYLVKANPELPSLIQQGLRPFGHARSATRTRLLLCGSALTVMGKLLTGTAPLRGSRDRFSRKILGPRFEQICRSWTLNYADPDRLGGLPAKVSTGVVNDAAGKSVHQVDVVVTGIADGGKTPLLAIGEAKWGEAMDAGHVERLRQIRSLLTATGKFDTSNTKLICFSGAGFGRRLHEAAGAGSDILLVDADELYG